MSIGSVLNTGIQGVQTGVRGMEQAAQEIVQAGSSNSTNGGSGDFVEPIMDLKLYENSVEASAKVIKTADEMIGTLLDTMA